MYFYGNFSSELGKVTGESRCNIQMVCLNCLLEPGSPGVETGLVDSLMAWPWAFSSSRVSVPQEGLKEKHLSCEAMVVAEARALAVCPLTGIGRDREVVALARMVVGEEL